MEKIKRLFECLKRVKVSTWIRLVVLAVAVINAAMRMCGCDTIPLGNETAEDVASVIVLVIGTLNAYWKNNSFTEAALVADELLQTIKESEK